MNQVSIWRNQPYRPFFFLGLLLALAGVGHWLLYALGWLPAAQGGFHAFTQIQGFMACFACGFLFTMIPRRTATAPPATWQMALGLAAPVLLVLFSWMQAFAWAQLTWLLLVLVMVSFVVARMRGSGGASGSGSGRRPPNSFVWIPLAFLTSLLGAGFLLAYEWADLSLQCHRFGRLLVTQGLFLGLIFGVGGMFIPLVTRGESSSDGAADASGARIRLTHALAWLLLLGSFYLEVWQRPVLGLGLRALLVAMVLVLACRAHRPVTSTGLHRHMILFSVRMLPLGYALAALMPDKPQIGMHVVFVLGFALLTLCVGMHVALAHGGAQHLVQKNPLQVPIFGLLMLLALCCRGLYELDPGHRMLWLGLASALFVLASMVWAQLVFPRLLRSASP